MSRRLQESYLSSFTYTPPYINPEQLLYDFYFFVGYATPDLLSLLQDDEVWSLNDALDTCIAYLHPHMTRVLKYAIAAELRNLKTRSQLRIFFTDTRFDGQGFLTLFKELRAPPKAADFCYDFMTSPSIRISRDKTFEVFEAWQKKHSVSNEALISICNFLFTKILWEELYGGDNWDRVVQGYARLVYARTWGDKVAAIDTAYNLEHNTNVIFDKLQTYYKRSDNTFHSYEPVVADGYNWVKQALNLKKNSTSIWDFSGKVSPQIEKLLGFIASLQKEYKDTSSTNMQSPETPRSKEPEKFLVGDSVRPLGIKGTITSIDGDELTITPTKVPSKDPPWTSSKQKDKEQASP